MLRVVTHLPAILPMLGASRRSALGQLVRHRPEIVAYSLYRYLAENWSVQTRVARIVQHCRIVDERSGVLAVAPDEVVDLIACDAVGPEYRLTLDRARWLTNEGLLVISLWEGVDRLFSLAFNLAREGENLVVFVGGFQGRGDDDVLDRYRRFTKAACGMRPRDFLIEIFKAFCRALGVQRIYAVAGRNHSMRSLYVTKGVVAGHDLALDYDKAWLERGASDRGNGFFDLPVEAGRRHVDEIAVKKRSTYRRRYAMLDEIEAGLQERVHVQTSVAENAFTPNIGLLNKIALLALTVVILSIQNSAE